MQYFIFKLDLMKNTPNQHYSKACTKDTIQTPIFNTQTLCPPSNFLSSHSTTCALCSSHAQIPKDVLVPLFIQALSAILY